MRSGDALGSQVLNLTKAELLSAKWTWRVGANRIESWSKPSHMNWMYLRVFWSQFVVESWIRTKERSRANRASAGPWTIRRAGESRGSPAPRWRFAKQIWWRFVHTCMTLYDTTTTMSIVFYGSQPEAVLKSVYGERSEGIGGLRVSAVETTVKTRN